LFLELGGEEEGDTEEEEEGGWTEKEDRGRMHEGGMSRSYGRGKGNRRIMKPWKGRKEDKIVRTIPLSDRITCTRE
jgi:hypothetical protein